MVAKIREILERDVRPYVESDGGEIRFAGFRDGVVEVVLQALHDAEIRFGIMSGVILCGIRNISPAHSLEMAELTVAYKGRGVVGFDLAGAGTANFGTAFAIPTFS